MSQLKPSRRTFVKTTAAATAAASFGFPFIAKGAPEHEIKIATLAPDGSDWAKEFKRNRSLIEERSGGRVKIKIYAGGVMGDEPTMIRKIRTGQLHGAAVTSVGLGVIDKRLLVMQMPLMFKNTKQLDYVRDKMQPTFDSYYESAGFKHGQNGDVGEIYLFTNTKVQTPDDLKNVKLWVWDADFVTKATARAAGVNGVELGVPDVLASLETGLIDGFPASPYAAIALQWYAKASYVTNLKLSMGIGASVMSLDKWNALDDDLKAIFNEVSAESQSRLLSRIRRANAMAVKTLQKKGLSVVEPQAIDAWTGVADKVRQSLVGSAFPADLVAKLDGHLKDAAKMG